MMRGDGEPKQRSSGDETRAMASVPRDHVLIKMHDTIEWEAVEAELAVYYDRWVGRPGWPAALMVRMLLLEQYANLSDREAHEQVGYNLLYRRFVGLGLDEAVPDDTTLVKFRARVGEEGIRKVFEVINEQWAAAGLIGEERRAVDGVHVLAKVAHRSLAGLLRKGREVIVGAVEEAQGGTAEALRERYVEAERPEGSEQEVVAAEVARTEELIKEVEGLTEEGVQARVAQVATLLSGKVDRVVSFDDPDARWGHKSEEMVFCGYKVHEAQDPDSRLITGVTVVPGNAHEGVKTDELLAVQSPPLKKGATIIADGYYNNATTVGQVQKAGMRPCFAGLRAQRVSDDFGYDREQDQMVCRAGKHSIGKVRVDNGDLYYFSMTDCADCPLRDKCLTRGEREGKAFARRRVYLSDVRKAKILAGEAGSQWRKEQLKVRYRIEAKFWEQVNRHRLRYTRYWGLPKVTVQALLNVIAVNAKRAVKLLKESIPPPQAVAEPMVGAG